MEHEYHRELKARVSRFLLENAWQVFEEAPLPNNKIADVLAVDGNGKLLIIEVKTTVHRCLLWTTLEKYGPYCHGLYIATGPAQFQELLQPEWLLHWREGIQRVGLLSLCVTHISAIRAAAPNYIPEHRAAALRARFFPSVRLGERSPVPLRSAP